MVRVDQNPEKSRNIEIGKEKFIKNRSKNVQMMNLSIFCIFLDEVLYFFLSDYKESIKTV